MIIDERYEVVRPVGRGGSGIVFEARDLARDGASVALKVYSGPAGADLEILVAEQRILSRLRDPAIPALVDAGAIRSVTGGPDGSPPPQVGAPYLAREFVDGVDLLDATRGLLWSDIRPFVVALVRALGVVHRQGVAHGDLKPGNVLCPRVPAGKTPVRLIDFGPGTTPEYLAPERVRGAQADPRSDLYALGVTLYRVITGELPFSGRGAREVLQAQLDQAPAPLSGRGARVPAEVEAAILRLLEKVPGRRFGSASAFLRELGEPESSAEEQRLVVSLDAIPLVARDEDVASITGVLDGRARGRAVLIEGGRGSGRSRLLREAALLARFRGARVAAGAARGEPRPFALFAEALPELGPVLAGIHTKDEAERLQARDALASRVLELCRETPLALILDDLDLAGDEDRALAALLARRNRRGKAPLSIFASALTGSHVELEGARIGLSELPDTALPELLRGALGPIVNEHALAVHLGSRGGGNPRLIHSALRALARSGALTASPSGVRFDPARALPSTEGGQLPLTTLLPGALPTDGARRTTLVLLAFARPVPLALLSRAAGLAPAEVLAVWKELSRSGVGVEVGGRLGLISEAVPDGCFSAEEWSTARRAAGEALLATPGADVAEAGLLLAQGGAREESLPHLLAGAERAWSAGALDLARRLFREAVLVADGEGRFRALLGLGLACAAAGALADATTSLEEALAVAPAGERGKVMLHLCLAKERSGDLDAAGSLLVEARRVGCDEGQATRLEIMLFHGRGELLAERAALERALAGARPGSAEALSPLCGLGQVAHERGEYAEAARLLERALSICPLSRGDPRSRGTIHLNLGLARAALEDRSSAMEHYRQAIRCYRAAGYRSGVASAWIQMGWIKEREEDLAGAVLLYRKAARVARALGNQTTRKQAITSLGMAHLKANRLEDARRALALARSIPSEQSYLLRPIAEARARVYARLGQLERALRIARRFLTREKRGGNARGIATARWTLGEVLLAKGDARAAVRELLRALVVFARKGSPSETMEITELLTTAYRQLAGLPQKPARSDLQGDAAAREARLTRLELVVGRLAASIGSLSQEQDERRLLERVCEDAVALLGAERAFIVIRRDGGGVRFAATRNARHETLLRPESKAPHAVLEVVLRDGNAVSSSDALKDRRLGEMTSIQVLDVRSVLAVPIREGSAILGALYADHRFRPGGFGEDAEQLLSTLAAIAASAIARERRGAELRASRDEVTALRSALEVQAKDRGAAASPVESGQEASLPIAFQRIVGRSDALRSVLRVASRAAASHLPILILGESGTGKELLARAIHLASPRRQKPFVAESCAALPESLLETELFGHARGAFTGADRERRGLFEEASGGTLFLDEIGDTSPALQAKLLRALQEGEIRPVGAAAARTVDVRVVAATNKDLEAMRKEGLFRDDLFYRLGAVTLRLPPLRERRSDVLDLAERILSDQARATGAARFALDPGAAETLMAYEWPGNVRELDHVLRAATLFARGHRIDRDAISAAGIPAPRAREAAPPPSEHEGVAPVGAARSYTDWKAEEDGRERDFVRAALHASGGNVVRAAAALGLSRYSLKRIMQRLGLEAGR